VESARDQAQPTGVNDTVSSPSYSPSFSHSMNAVLLVCYIYRCAWAVTGHFPDWVVLCLTGFFFPLNCTFSFSLGLTELFFSLSMIIREIWLCSAWVCLIVSFLTSGIAQGVLNKSKLFFSCLLCFRIVFWSFGVCSRTTAWRP